MKFQLVYRRHKLIMSVVAFTLIYFLFGKYNYELYIIFYLLVGEDLNPVTEGSARVNVKERKKKERQDRRAKKRKSRDRRRNLLAQLKQLVRS